MNTFLSTRLEKIDKIFYRTTIAIALPVVLQNLISIGLNMLDTMMIGKLGLDELAGVGAANRIFFVFIICCYGFISGIMILVSQYWGARDIYNIRRCHGIGYTFAIAWSLLVMTVAYLAAEPLISLFVSKPIVIAFGVRYLRIALLSYLFTACSIVISYNSRAVHLVVIPTIINAIALTCNTILNYCLIYGNFGFAQMGVEGAALATVISRVLELVLLLTYTYTRRDHPLSAPLKILLGWDRQLLNKVLQKALPTTASEAAWSIGSTLYYVAYGKVGDAAIAVVQVCSVVNDLFQAVFMGLASASAVMIGNELGRRNKQLANSYAWHFLRITLICALAVAALYIFSRGWMVRFYDFDAATSTLLNSTMLIFALFFIPRMLTFSILIGVLRAGGDTTYTLVVDAGSVWLLGVPLSFISAVVLHWSLPLVVAMSLIEEVIKLFICLHRMRSCRWMNVLI